jgi:hypothetical protein
MCSIAHWGPNKNAFKAIVFFAVELTILGVRLLNIIMKVISSMELIIFIQVKNFSNLVTNKMALEYSIHALFIRRPFTQFRAHEKNMPYMLLSEPDFVNLLRSPGIDSLLKRLQIRSLNT